MTDVIYKLARDARISNGSQVHQNNAVACSDRASSSLQCQNAIADPTRSAYAMQIQATPRNADTSRDVLSKHFAQAKDPGNKETIKKSYRSSNDFLRVEIRLRKVIMTLRLMRL